MSTKIESLELEIVSNSKSATNGIEALSLSLNNLKTSTKNLGLNSASKDMREFTKATKENTEATKKAALSITDVYHGLKMAGEAISQVGTKIWKSVKNSMSYTEDISLFNASMGQYADSAFDYAQRVSEIMGIDIGEWARSQGVFMTLATGFGVASDRASVMSQNLTQLGYDIASFYNLDTNTAMLKLKSGLAGELEPLRAIGYDLSQAKLEATALELGITKSVSAMTQAEKAQLRYYAIMTQVTTVHGDMAETLDSPANQLRVLKAEFKMASREIGSVFIPVVQAVLPPVTAVTKVIGTLAKSIAGLLGYNALDGARDSTSSTAENTYNITENLSDAQDEAKKLKSYMLGIDELNVIDPNAGKTDTSDMFDFPLVGYDFGLETVESRVNSITEKIQDALGLNKDIDSWMDLLDTRLGSMLITVGLIGGSLALWKIGGAFVTNFTTITTGLGKLGGVAGLYLAVEGIKYLWENTETIVGKIGGVLTAAPLVVGAILTMTGINMPLGLALMAVGAVSMGSAIALNTSALSDEVKGVIGLITEMVAGAFLVVGALLAFSGAAIPMGIALLVSGAGMLVTGVAPNWNAIKDLLTGPIGLITALVSGAMLAIGALLLFSAVNIVLGIGLLAAGAVGLVTTVVCNWNSIASVLKTVLSSLLSIVTGAMMVIGVLLLLSGAGIGLGLALLFAGMAGTKAAWKVDNNPITNFVKGMMNGIIKTMNFVINMINKVVSKLSFGIIEIPLIPLMAEGGFPDQGQMFIAREAGAEMVGNIGRRTAVVNNEQIVASISGGVAEANAEQNAILREQNTLLRALLEKESGVYIDGKHLTASVEKYQRERGRVLITGGVV